MRRTARTSYAGALCKEQPGSHRFFRRSSQISNLVQSQRYACFTMRGSRCPPFETYIGGVIWGRLPSCCGRRVWCWVSSHPYVLQPGEPFVNNSPALFLLLISCLLSICGDRSKWGRPPVNQPCSQNSSSLSSLACLSPREALPLRLPRVL